MKIRIEKSFDKDIDKINDKKLLKELRTFISTVENAESIHEIPYIKENRRLRFILSDKNRRFSIRFGSDFHKEAVPSQIFA